jgi:hypothetical protein
MAGMNIPMPVPPNPGLGPNKTTPNTDFGPSIASRMAGMNIPMPVPSNPGLGPNKTPSDSGPNNGYPHISDAARSSNNRSYFLVLIAFVIFSFAPSFSVKSNYCYLFTVVEMVMMISRRRY